jgi:hypothetical protein
MILRERPSRKLSSSPADSSSYPLVLLHASSFQATLGLTTSGSTASLVKSSGPPVMQIDIVEAPRSVSNEGLQPKTTMSLFVVCRCLPGFRRR